MTNEPGQSQWQPPTPVLPQLPPALPQLPPPLSQQPLPPYNVQQMQPSSPPNCGLPRWARWVGVGCAVIAALAALAAVGTVQNRAKEAEAESTTPPVAVDEVVLAVPETTDVPSGLVITAPPVTEPGISDEDIALMAIDVTWEQNGAATCEALNDFVATGMMTRSEAIDFGIESIKGGAGSIEWTPAVDARFRELLWTC